jgi:hypothetical protein
MISLQHYNIFTKISKITFLKAPFIASLQPLFSALAAASKCITIRDHFSKFGNYVIYHPGTHLFRAMPSIRGSSELDRRYKTIEWPREGRACYEAN